MQLSMSYLCCDEIQSEWMIPREAKEEWLMRVRARD